MLTPLIPDFYLLVLSRTCFESHNAVLYKANEQQTPEAGIDHLCVFAFAELRRDQPESDLA